MSEQYTNEWPDNDLAVKWCDVVAVLRECLKRPLPCGPDYEGSHEDAVAGIQIALRWAVYYSHHPHSRSPRCILPEPSSGIIMEADMPDGRLWELTANREIREITIYDADGHVALMYEVDHDPVSLWPEDDPFVILHVELIKRFQESMERESTLRRVFRTETIDEHQASDIPHVP